MELLECMGVNEDAIDMLSAALSATLNAALTHRGKSEAGDS